jgi:Dynamin family.
MSGSHHDTGTFPPAYAARIGEALVRVDASLTEALQCLDPVVEGSPFATRIADATPVHRQLMLDHLARVRAAMQTMVERHHLPLPTPTRSAIQTCRLRVNEALLTVAGLDPRRPQPADSTRPPLPEELNEDASRIVGHLIDLLETLQTSLGQDLGPAPTRSMPGQTEPVEAAPERATSGASESLLAELQRITAIHGLGELHGSVCALARHMSSLDVVVGVFGGVSAGKSSLINSLLGTSLLPVSAIPTTTVPIEICHGRVERGWVDFVNAKPEIITRARVAEFVDDHHNPSNLRGVTRIRFESPASVLSDGLVLIDTPGVNWGAALADAHPPAHPWCDLAIVLVSATSSLTLPEARLVEQLCSKGAQVLVLVTKVDLLAADDRWRIYEYIVRSLWRSTRLDVPVYLVSMLEEDPPWRRAWVEGPFADAVRQCRLERETRRNRQLATLRRDVLGTLQERLRRHAATAPGRAQLADAINGLTDVNTLLVTASQQMLDPAALAQRVCAELANELVHNATMLWRETHEASFDATRLVELAAHARAQATAAMTVRRLEALRAKVGIALTHAIDALADPAIRGRLSSAGDAPPFTLDCPLPLTLLPRSPGWVLGRWGFYLSARRCLAQAPALSIVQHSLHAYFDALDEWQHNVLGRFAREYQSCSERLRPMLYAAAERGMPDQSHIADDLCRDIGTLQHAYASRRPDE